MRTSLNEFSSLQTHLVQSNLPKPGKPPSNDPHPKIQLIVQNQSQAKANQPNTTLWYKNPQIVQAISFIGALAVTYVAYRTFANGTSQGSGGNSGSNPMPTSPLDFSFSHPYCLIGDTVDSSQVFPDIIPNDGRILLIEENSQSSRTLSESVGGSNNIPFATFIGPTFPFCPSSNGFSNSSSPIFVPDPSIEERDISLTQSTLSPKPTPQENSEEPKPDLAQGEESLKAVEKEVEKQPANEGVTKQAAPSNIEVKQQRAAPITIRVARITQDQTKILQEAVKKLAQDQIKILQEAGEKLTPEGLAIFLGLDKNPSKETKQAFKLVVKTLTPQEKATLKSLKKELDLAEKALKKHASKQKK